MNKAAQMQMDVRRNSELLQRELKDLYNWQDEIKAAEMKRKCALNSSAEYKVPDLRTATHAAQLAEAAPKAQHNKKQRQDATVQQQQQTSATPKAARVLSADEQRHAEANQLKNKGNNYVKIENYQAAISCYDAAIELYPQDAIYYCNRALCHQRQERYEQCIEDCNAALKVDSKCAKAYYRRMQANEFIGQHREALADCTRVIGLEPDNKEAKRSFERISKRLQEQPSLAAVVQNDEQRHAEANVHKDTGNELYKSRNYQAALESYSKAIEIYDKDSVYYCNRAICQQRLKRYEACIEDCDAALRIDDNNVKAHYRRMQANESLEHYLDALYDCTRVLELDAQNKDANISLDRINLRLKEAATAAPKKPKEAVDQTAAVSENLPLAPAVVEANEATSTEEVEQSHALADEWKVKGNNCVKEQQYETAIEHYTKAIEIYGNDAFYYTNRACCQQRLKRYEKCIEDCDKAIKLSEDCKKAYYWRMLANDRLARYTAALFDCGKLLTFEPENKDFMQRYQSLNKRINDAAKPRMASKMSMFASDFVPVYTVQKTPNQASHKPLRPVPIKELPTKKISELSDREIDDLFAGPCPKYKEIKESETEPAQASTPVVELPAKAAVEEQPSTTTEEESPRTLSAPKTTVEFYETWRDLSMEEKYVYLKSIDTKNLCSLLGSSCDSKTFDELLHVLHDFYLRKKEPSTAETLLAISSNPEVQTVSLFLEGSTYEMLEYLLDVLKATPSVNNVTTQQIAKNFCFSD